MRVLVRGRNIKLALYLPCRLLFRLCWLLPPCPLHPNGRLRSKRERFFSPHYNVLSSNMLWQRERQTAPGAAACLELTARLLYIKCKPFQMLPWKHRSSSSTRTHCLLLGFLTSDWSSSCVRTQNQVVLFLICWWDLDWIFPAWLLLSATDGSPRKEIRQPETSIQGTEFCCVVDVTTNICNLKEKF